jgi:hypothetical protein
VEVHPKKKYPPFTRIFLLEAGEDLNEEEGRKTTRM